MASRAAARGDRTMSAPAISPSASRFKPGNCTRCGNYRRSLLNCSDCTARVCFDCKGMHRCVAHLDGSERLPEANDNQRRGV